MTTSIEINISLKENFADKCKIIVLKDEYPGYTGTEKYGIFTDIQESELKTRYGEMLDKYHPYILLSREIGEERDRYKRNEVKFAVRQFRGNYYSIDEDFDNKHPECSTPDFTDTLCSEPNQRLMKALGKLRNTQRERIMLMFFEGYTNDEIAALQGKTASAVSQSITSSLEKLKEILQKP